MSRRTSLYFAVTTVLAGLMGVFSAGSAGASGAPHISAHPNSVMVNGTTELVGKNFQPSTSLTVKECGLKNWVVPQNPCDSTNSIVVTTNSHGGFKSAFTVQTCTTGTENPGFSEKCFIGVPTPTGVDTITLVGAVRITVTGP